MYLAIMQWIGRDVLGRVLYSMEFSLFPESLAGAGNRQQCVRAGETTKNHILGDSAESL